MGLDMYLYAQTRGERVDLSESMTDELYDSIYWCYPEWENEDWYTHSRDLDAERHRPQQIQQVGYWRKANQIHAWFVDHVQGGKDECQYTEVSMEQLAGLKVTCQRVLDGAVVPSDALPTRAGFFFGTCEYGDYYRTTCQDTITIIDGIELVQRERAQAGLTPMPLWYHSSW